MRKFKQADTLDLCMNDVEKYLRTCYAFIKQEPIEDYYTFELQRHKIGIKLDTAHFFYVVFPCTISKNN